MLAKEANGLRRSPAAGLLSLGRGGRPWVPGAVRGTAFCAPSAIGGAVRGRAGLSCRLVHALLSTFHPADGLGRRFLDPMACTIGTSLRNPNTAPGNPLRV